MYTPNAFLEDDKTAIRAVIEGTGLACLVTQTPDGPEATHLPLWLAADEGTHGTLYGHLARANPQAKTAAGSPALAIFAGPDFYVSPSWYPSKPETHKVVPTWNYVAVHAVGPLELFDDEERLLAMLERLTDRHEAALPAPWTVADAPADFVRALLAGIVGVRIEIARLEGKRKMSQNRDARDRAGVRAGVRAHGPAASDLGALVPE